MVDLVDGVISWYTFSVIDGEGKVKRFLERVGVIISFCDIDPARLEQKITQTSDFLFNSLGCGEYGPVRP